jgi:lactoylglutathione lyase
MKILPTLLVVLALSLSLAAGGEDSPANTEQDRQPAMELGAFSVSLAVKDIATSREFYEKLGFRPAGGDPAQNWQVLRNGTTTIGLFQGMFEENIMTFNPGWNSSAEALDEFTDVRELQRRLKASGVTLISEADEATTGPASVVLADPDGNTIFLDQHVE